MSALSAAPDSAPAFRVAAIVVAFAPARDPLAVAAAVRGAVDRVLVVDNAPGGHPRLAGVALPVDLRVLANGNRGGIAGAYNAALAVLADDDAPPTHVLLLDDDSDVAPLAAFLAAPSTRAAAQAADVAAVAPTYVERATGLRLAPIVLSRFRYRVLPRGLSAPTAVAFLINSMSLWRIDAMRRIGAYDEALGVDHVDTDYCLRAATLGYRLVLDPTFAFVHAIGERRAYRFLGRTLQAGGHPPARRRSIARNTVLLARRHGRRWPAFAVLCAARLAYETLGVVVAEDDRAAKLRALAAGALAGLRGDAAAPQAASA